MMRRLILGLAIPALAAVATAGPVNGSCDDGACKDKAASACCAGEKADAKAQCADKGKGECSAEQMAQCTAEQRAQCKADAKAQCSAEMMAQCTAEQRAQCQAGAKAQCSAEKMAQCQAGATATAITGLAGVAGPINTTCPMSGEALDADAQTVSYQGKTIGFCCEKCAAKFEKMDDAGKAAMLKKMAAQGKAMHASMGMGHTGPATANSACLMSGEALGADAEVVSYHGKDYGFCCDKCAGKFQAMGDADKAYVLAKYAAADHASASDESAKTINVLDPISHKKLAGDVVVREIQGKSIGFASEGNARLFADWSTKNQAAYLGRVVAGAEWGDAYSLDTCPISGEKLGAMGKPVVRYYDGREVRFCCDGCIEDFEADTAAGFRAIDAKMIADQKPSYPMTTCVVGGDELGDDAIDYVYRNRLVRFCCEGCIDKFEANPTKFLAKLDEAAIAQQRASYPFDTCVVMPDDTLDEDAPATELVVAGRLVRLCCENCVRKVRANPRKYIAMIDAARKGEGTKGTVGRQMGEAGGMGGMGGGH